MDADTALRKLAIGLATATVATASLTYTGAVAGSAFLAFVLVAALGAGLITALIGQPQQLGGLIAGLGAAIAWSVAVNALSGESSGPVARSSAVCGVGAALAVYSARRLWAPPFLASTALLQCGAMYYGAAGEVRTVALLTALLALVTTAAMDAARHRRRFRTPRVLSIAVGLLVAAAFVLASVGAQQVISRTLQSNRATVSALVQPESIRPPWAPPRVLEAPATTSITSPPGTVTPATTVQRTTTTVQRTTTTVHRTTTTRPPQKPHRKVRKRQLPLALVITLVCIALVVLAVAIRLWVGAYRLRRWKRKLRSQSPAVSAAAAWSWMVFELARLGWDLPENPSIDQMLEDMNQLDWPEQICTPAGAVAERGALAAFGALTITDQEVTDIWALADDAVTAARSCTSTWPRTRALLRLART